MGPEQGARDAREALESVRALMVKQAPLAARLADDHFAAVFAWIDSADQLLTDYMREEDSRLAAAEFPEPGETTDPLADELRRFLAAS